MAWLFVPEQADWSSGCGSPSETDTAVWVTSSAIATQRPRSWRGWRTRPWIRLLSGTTLRHSTAERGVEQWISSLRASRASRSASPANGRVSLTTAGSGRTLPASFARFDPATSSWRTHPSLSGMDSVISSRTWPRSGSLRNGIAYRRPSSARRTSASVSTSSPAPGASLAGSNRSPHGKQGVRPALAKAVVLWPTPCAADGDRQSKTFGRGNPTLHSAVLWATPTAMDSHSSGGKPGSGNLTLTDMAVRSESAWPTPTASDAKRGAEQTDRGPSQGPTLSSVISRFSRQDPATTDGADSSRSSRVLNPRFVEMLMGWPLGWTDCERSVTGWCQWWQRWRSYVSEIA